MVRELIRELRRLRRRSRHLTYVFPCHYAALQQIGARSGKSFAQMLDQALDQH